jgi:hypothetical protein
MTTQQAWGSTKSDPLMATFNAIALMATNPQSAISELNIFYV